MTLSKRLFILFSIFMISLASMQPAQAVDYTITYNANETQHQTGVTAGTVPSAAVFQPAKVKPCRVRFPVFAETVTTVPDA